MSTELHPPVNKELGADTSYASSVNSKGADASVLNGDKTAVPSVADKDERVLDEKSAPQPETLREENEDVEISKEIVPGQEEDLTDYPTGWKLGLITTALCLAVFCMALDNTIIATAIPRITDNFHALNDVGWYISVYLLTTCSFQLIFGKLYTFYSIKWIFLGALLVFEVGSVVCGVAPTSKALIAGRAIAGVGSAGIFSGVCVLRPHHQ
jgi:hypothetical protein